ncbi:MAG: SprT family zinc-dependent metalloprotease [Alkalispirochaeta sp.]
MATRHEPVTSTYRNGPVEIQFQLHRSRRKTIGISVYPGGVVSVRAPRGADPRAVMDVLRKKEPWLLRKIQELSPVEPRNGREWHGGMEVPLLGRPRPLRVVFGSRPGVVLTPAGFEVRLTERDASAEGRIDFTASAAPHQLHRAVSRWYHRRAPAVFTHRLRVVRRDPRIAALGDPGTLKVRRMRRRWGSCFLDGRINLNTELLGEPVALIDYVIIHELCHLREHNHSPRFYRLMDEVMPDWREHRVRLHRSATAGFLHTP